MTRKFISSHESIPNAPFYVCCTDSFMCSGRKNRLIFPCDSAEEAEIVENNALARKDQKRVTLCTAKPKLNLNLNEYQVKTKNDYPSWYVAGYF